MSLAPRLARSALLNYFLLVSDHQQVYLKVLSPAGFRRGRPLAVAVQAQDLECELDVVEAGVLPSDDLESELVTEAEALALRLARLQED